MVDERPARLTSGTLLADRYRLQDTIERAGFGHAWRARDESNGRPVEVHDLGTPRGTVGLGEAVESLTRHAAAKHRALAATHDEFVHAGGVVVVCASSDGAPLDVWFNERARGGAGARLEATRAVVDQVAQGLWALHRTGDPPLAHGAFGGPCVRVESRGVQAVVRVEAQGWGRVVAPPGWWVCPPEGEAQTPAADVFALGLLAATLLTGRSAATTPDAVRSRFDANAPEVDASVVDAIAACLTADPTLRIPDARALRDRFMQASVSWKPRERPVVAPPSRARHTVEEDEAPVIVAAPPRGPQVWLVPAKCPVAPAPPPPDAVEESTQVDAPRPPSPRPVVAKRQPPVEEDEATSVDAPPSPAAAVEEESTQVESPLPPPRGSAARVEREEATDAASGDMLRGSVDERWRHPSSTRRVDLSDATRVRPAPDDEPTDVAAPVRDEATSPIGAHPGAFAARSETRERTVVPVRRTHEPPAFVPEENTAPMDDPSRVVRGPVTTVSAPPASPSAPPINPAPEGISLPLPVAGVIAAGVLLGLVLWWANR